MQKIVRRTEPSTSDREFYNEILMLFTGLI
jgi:hypothetical protein